MTNEEIVRTLKEVHDLVSRAETMLDCLMLDGLMNGSPNISSRTLQLCEIITCMIHDTSNHINELKACLQGLKKRLEGGEN